MNREIIAVDVDDVLAAEVDGIREFINTKFGTSHTPDDYYINAPYWYYWEHVWNVSEEEAAERFETYVSSGHHASFHTVEGAVEAISELQQGYDLAIVTSRNHKLADLTHDWLEEKFPSVFRQIEFVEVWSRDKSISKAVICNSLGASYLIDDNIEHCRLAAEEGIKSLLFGDYGWNQTKKLPEGVGRAQNWGEVLKYFRATD